jgi:hypothetical protein
MPFEVCVTQIPEMSSVSLHSNKLTKSVNGVNLENVKEKVAQVNGAAFITWLVILVGTFTYDMKKNILITKHYLLIQFN